LVFATVAYSAPSLGTLSPGSQEARSRLDFEGSLKSVLVFRTQVYGAATDAAPNRRWLLQQYAEYAPSVLGQFGTDSKGNTRPNVRALVKPLLNLFHGTTVLILRSSSNHGPFNT